MMRHHCHAKGAAKPHATVDWRPPPFEEKQVKQRQKTKLGHPINSSSPAIQFSHFVVLLITVIKANQGKSRQKPLTIPGLGFAAHKKSKRVQVSPTDGIFAHDTIRQSSFVIRHSIRANARI